MEKMKLTGAPKTKGGADIVGIDLGTTNFAVSVFTADTVPTLLPIGKDGKFTVPSCVRWDGFDATGKCPQFTVGADAYEERYKANVIYSVKRIMGSGQSVILTLRENPPYPSPSDSDWDDSLDLQLSPAQVSGIILKHLKEKVAEFYRDIDRCVITVPAYFNQRQIEDTLLAAEEAGWICKQILKEPTSASYIYSQLGYATNGSVVIYDLGGGTFDVTHMNFLRRDSIPSKLLTSLKRQYGIDINNIGADINDQYFCRVLGTYGDVHLGGDDIDRVFGDKVIAESGVSLTTEQKEMLYLRCEEFKKMRVDAMDARIGEHYFRLTSSGLNDAIDIIFDRTLELMKDIDMSDVKTIVLVGGSTKSNRIRNNIQSAFPNVEVSLVLNPDATVALGAGSVAKALAGNKSLMYADVLPLPIGILVEEKDVEVCIARNTSMPYTIRKTYHTIHDNQETISLHLYQGLSSNPSKCTYLGCLTMKNIPKRPAGEVKVDVLFVLTGQGTLKIHSNIEGTSREEKLVIDNIFDVKKNNTSGVASGAVDDGKVSPVDSFEQSFMPQLMEDAEAIEMFLERRKLLQLGTQDEDVQQRLQECEDAIAMKVIGAM